MWPPTRRSDVERRNHSAECKHLHLNLNLLIIIIIIIIIIIVVVVMFIITTITGFSRA